MANRREIKRDAEWITTTGYLAVSASGDLRLTATSPHLAATEIVMKLSIRVPCALFRKPALSAEIVVPVEAGSPERIEASTVNNIREAVRQATEMDLSITIVPPKDDN